MNLSTRLATIPASPIRKLVPFAQKAKADGVTVYHLNIGDPDIKTPEVMLDVLRGWKTNPISYALSQGDPEFLRAVEWYYHKIGYSFISQANIQISTGGSEAISMALFATCNPGDSVLVFEPFYANYNAFAALYGIELIPIPTTAESGFHLPQYEEIVSCIRPHTKAILFCNPNNPTGTVYAKAEIELLVRIAKEKELYLLSDEVYREFVYDGKRHTSLLSYMQAIPDRVIVLDSLSKRYSLCGARLGMLVSLNAELLAGVLRIAQGRLSSGFIDQAMASRLVEVPDSYTSNVQAEYEQRRDTVYEGLRVIPGVLIPKPEGAFYSIATLPVTDAEHFCTWLLTDFRDNNETVMLAPANGFYASTNMGKNQVRIAYVLEIPKLKRSIEILLKALSSYKY